MLAAVLDGEVEEYIRSGETAFWDERAVEKRLMIDSLGLPGNELMWIEGGGAALEVEPDRCCLDGVDFLGAMEVDL